jgi:hypothetical protein
VPDGRRRPVFGRSRRPARRPRPRAPRAAAGPRAHGADVSVPRVPGTIRFCHRVRPARARVRPILTLDVNDDLNYVDITLGWLLLRAPAAAAAGGAEPGPRRSCRRLSLIRESQILHLITAYHIAVSRVGHGATRHKLRIKLRTMRRRPYTLLPPKRPALRFLNLP